VHVLPVEFQKERRKELEEQRHVKQHPLLDRKKRDAQTRLKSIHLIAG